MGQVSFHSSEIPLKATKSRVFAFLADLDNMEQLMPKQIINWKSDKKSCSFDIVGMTHIDLFLGQIVPDQAVTIDSGPENPIATQIRYELKEDAQNDSSCEITLIAELSMMQEMLASGPLQNLVNIMADKLKDLFGS